MIERARILSRIALRLRAEREATRHAQYGPMLPHRTTESHCYAMQALRSMQYGVTLALQIKRRSRHFMCLVHSVNNNAP